MRKCKVMKVCRVLFFIFYPILHTFVIKKREKKMPMYCWMYTCIAALPVHFPPIFCIGSLSIPNTLYHNELYIGVGGSPKWTRSLFCPPLLISSPIPYCNPSSSTLLLHLLCSCWGLILHPPHLAVLFRPLP